MINKPKLDERQEKMKWRISSMYAMLVLIAGLIIAVLMSMEPIDSITTERDSVNIKLFYFEGNINTDGVLLNDDEARRIQSFNDNKICVSVFETADVSETAVKNFVLSWLYVKYPQVSITDDSLIHTKTRWRRSHEACDDTYLSNIFQYDKRKAQTDITMDNIVTNWWRSGLIIFLGAINIVMSLWFISHYKNEIEYYRER